MGFTAIKDLKDFFYQRTFKYKYRIRWALALAVALAVIIFYQFDIFERIELLTLDYRFRLKPAKPSGSDIVFIDMAEDSIHAIGGWPWPRSWHAALIKSLSDYKPKAIVFDVLFSEPTDETDDRVLEDAIKESGVVSLPLLFDLNRQDAAYLYKGEGVTSVTEPLPQFSKYAKGEGHINAIPDIDGTIRRVPPKISYKGRSAYQLGLKTGLDALGVKDSDVSFYPDRHMMKAGLPGGKTMKIPLDDRNQFMINWKGAWGKEFKHFSYIEVIRSYGLIKKGQKPAIDFNEFKDKICVIGLTVAGLTDIKPVPIENAYPAVGINATIINSIIKGDFIYNVPKRYNILIILLISILVTLYLSNFRLIGGMILATIAIISYAVMSIAAFRFFNVAVATFYPILCLRISTLMSVLWQIFLMSAISTC